MAKPKPECSAEMCERPSKYVGLCGMHYQRLKRPSGETIFGRHKPLHMRLWSRVEVRGGDECWEFTGPLNRAGYGKISLGGRGGSVIGSHRAAWLVTYGPIADDLHVCHRCDNPPCCRPDHLFLGTRSDNMLDAARKDRLHGGTLTWEQRQAIIAIYGAGIVTARAIAEAYGITQSAVENMTYVHRKRSQSANSSGS